MENHTDQIIRNKNIAVKIEHDALWLLIVHHNAREANVFENYDNAMYSSKENQFSILSKLKFIPMIDSGYEFLLEYPTTHPKEYNRWRQSLNPFDEYRDRTGFQNATGYDPIHIDFNEYLFGGMMRALSSSILSGCQQNDRWNYPVGAYSNRYGNNAFPGDGTMYEYHVDFWVRILPSQKLIFNCPTLNRKIRFYPSTQILIIILI